MSLTDGSIHSLSGGGGGAAFGYQSQYSEQQQRQEKHEAVTPVMVHQLFKATEASSNDSTYDDAKWHTHLDLTTLVATPRRVGC
jgi:hypothetical protein